MWPQVKNSVHFVHQSTGFSNQWVMITSLVEIGTSRVEDHLSQEHGQVSITTVCMSDSI